MTSPEFVNSLGIGKLILDMKGVILGANICASTKLNLSLENSDCVIFECCPELNLKSWGKLYNRLLFKKTADEIIEYLDGDNNIFQSKSFLTLDHSEIILYFNTQSVGSDQLMEMISTSIDQIDDMIYWVRPDSTFAFTNDAVSRKLGYTQKELSSMTVQDIDPEFTKRSFTEFFNKLKSHKYLEVEATNLTKDGKFIDVLASSTYVEYRDLPFSCVVIKDISKSKRIRKSLEEMKFTVENAKIMCIWTTLDGQIVFANHFACLKYGYSLDQFLDIHYSVITEQGTIKDLKRYSKEIESFDEWILESVHIKKDKTTFPVEVAASRLETELRDLNVFYITDITERIKRRKRNEQYRQEISDLKDKLHDEKEYLLSEIAEQISFHNIISVDPAYKDVLNKVQQVAETTATVLITGETGTGKELLARAVHKMSDRASDSLIKINCATLPKDLIESELFGHAKGAFTGAFAEKRGRFDLADNGTIFLDEIGEIPIELQSKLLRVLQEGEFQRIGDPRPHSVNVRIIAATNRNLKEEVRVGRFRQDLYYRLNVFPIHNIPLRERPKDIPQLVHHFVDKYSKKIGKPTLKVKKAAMTALSVYNYPGNVRELENIIERSVILSPGTTLMLDNTMLVNLTRKAEENEFLTFDEMQKEYIIKALELSRWKVTGAHSASQLLGINGKTLASKMRKFNITRIKY